MRPLTRIKRIEKNDADVIRALADAFAAEWPEWAGQVGRAAVERTFASGPAGSLPAVYGAFAADVPVGTVALRPWFGEEPMEQTPWVRGLWVAPAHRGRGVDRLLMQAVEAEARALGFHRVYAATTSIERLARRWGWSTFHRLDHEGETMVWMSRPL